MFTWKFVFVFVVEVLLHLLRSSTPRIPSGLGILHKGKRDKKPHLLSLGSSCYQALPGPLMSLTNRLRRGAAACTQVAQFIGAQSFHQQPDIKALLIINNMRFCSCLLCACKFTHIWKNNFCCGLFPQGFVCSNQCLQSGSVQVP